MVKIIGKSTWRGLDLQGTSNTVYTITTNSKATTYTFNICPADGNVFHIEKGDRKRKYCSNECRFKMRKKKT